MGKQIQGLMFVRKEGNKAVLVGVIDTKKELKNESQYEFIGKVRADGTFSIQTTGKIIDIQKEAEGNGIDGVLQLPIWRT